MSDAVNDTASNTASNMEDQVLNIASLRRMFREAAEEILSHRERLSYLDSVGGDGDHGSTMVRTMDALVAATSAEGDRPLNALLKDAGWKVLGVGGGASSALVGVLIGGMGDVELGRECDCRAVAQSFAAGLGAVERQTKARPGAKTMMDALVPAVEAIEAAARSGHSIGRAMEMAAAAAEAGAKATANMTAQYGRAKFLGAKTAGLPDAGATSIALIFKGFSKGFSQGFSNVIAKDKEG